MVVGNGIRGFPGTGGARGYGLVLSRGDNLKTVIALGNLRGIGFP